MLSQCWKSLTITAKPFGHDIQLWYFSTKVPHLHFMMWQYISTSFHDYNVKRLMTLLVLHWKLTVTVKFFWHYRFSTNICSGYDMHEDDVWYLAFQVYAHQTAIRKKITQLKKKLLRFTVCTSSYFAMYSTMKLKSFYWIHVF